MMSENGILLVEDEAFIALELEMELKKAGFNVLAKFASGEDAVEYVNKVQPGLILMDIRLAGHMNGIEAARRIRNSYDIPIIFMTGYQDEDIMAPARSLEPVATFVKPISFQLLKMSIDSVFSRE